MSAFRSQLSWLFLASAGTALLAAPGCSDTKAQDASPPSQAAARTVSDQPLTESQRFLLDLAIDAASALPREPHLKTRSRSQQRVVDTCLELDQPWRALRYAERIDNWRRGEAFGDLGSYFAERGARAQAEHLVTLARQTLDECIECESQAWRLERIDAAIQRVRVALDPGRGSEGGPDLLASVPFDRLPAQKRVERLLERGGDAVDRGDRARALELVGAAREALEATTWLPEDSIVLSAEIASVRCRAGDSSGARTEVEAALAQFDAEWHKIFDIYRARALRAVAEALQVIGDRSAAAKVYERAVEAGALNPNSRPRAEDLSATCCSMALHGFEPDSRVRDRLAQIRRGLCDPW